MSNFSGFTSAFTSAVPTAGNGTTDILSSADTTGTIGYMYIGNMLFQWSTIINSPAYNNVTIPFPKAFSTLLGFTIGNYGQVTTYVNPYSGDLTNSSIKITSDSDGSAGESFFVWGLA